MARTAEAKQPASEPKPYAKLSKIERETLDMEALRYAGMMGHEFVGVCTRENGKRDTFIEANSAESIWDYAGTLFRDVVAYQKTRLGWKPVRRQAGGGR